jgi:general secretion pathway protein G
MRSGNRFSSGEVVCRRSVRVGGIDALSGFTFIEMLVVLSIIATLLSLVVLRYTDRMATAKETILQENLRVVRTSIQQFYGDHGRYPESLNELVEKRYLFTLPYDPVAGSASNWIIVTPPSNSEGYVFDIKSGADGTDRNGSSFQAL